MADVLPGAAVDGLFVRGLRRMGLLVDVLARMVRASAVQYTARVHALVGALWQVPTHLHIGHEQHDGPKPSNTCYSTVMSVRGENNSSNILVVSSMTRSHLRRLTLVLVAFAFVPGCDKPTAPVSNGVTGTPTPWLGIPSAVNQVIVFLHEGTGWMLNKSEVTVKKAGDVRAVESTSKEWVADFLISVHFGGETFETTAKDVPCDNDGIPTEAAVDRLRSSVEDIKNKMKRLQN